MKRQMLFVFFMALFMSLFMSFVLSGINVGFTKEMIQLWPKSFITAFFVAYPTAIVFAPVSNWLVNRLLKLKT